MLEKKTFLVGEKGQFVNQLTAFNNNNSAECKIHTMMNGMENIHTFQNIPNIYF